MSFFPIIFVSCRPNSILVDNFIPVKWWPSMVFVLTFCLWCSPSHSVRSTIFIFVINSGHCNIVHPWCCQLHHWRSSVFSIFGTLVYVIVEVYMDSLLEFLAFQWPSSILISVLSKCQFVIAFRLYIIDLILFSCVILVVVLSWFCIINVSCSICYFWCGSEYVYGYFIQQWNVLPAQCRSGPAFHLLWESNSIVPADSRKCNAKAHVIRQFGGFLFFRY